MLRRRRRAGRRPPGPAAGCRTADRCGATGDPGATRARHQDPGSHRRAPAPATAVAAGTAPSLATPGGARRGSRCSGRPNVRRTGPAGRLPPGRAGPRPAHDRAAAGSAYPTRTAAGAGPRRGRDGLARRGQHRARWGRLAPHRGSGALRAVPGDGRAEAGRPAQAGAGPGRRGRVGAGVGGALRAVDGAGGAGAAAGRGGGGRRASRPVPRRRGQSGAALAAGVGGRRAGPAGGRQLGAAGLGGAERAGAGRGAAGGRRGRGRAQSRAHPTCAGWITGTARAARERSPAGRSSAAGASLDDRRGATRAGRER